MRCARERRHAPSSGHALDLSLAPVLSKVKPSTMESSHDLVISTCKRSQARDWRHASSSLIESPEHSPGVGKLRLATHMGALRHLSGERGTLLSYQISKSIFFKN